jgi:hypothetical protein
MTRRGGFGPRHGQFMTRIEWRASGAPELTSRFGQRSVGRRDNDTIRSKKCYNLKSPHYSVRAHFLAVRPTAEWPRVADLGDEESLSDRCWYHHLPTCQCRGLVPQYIGFTGKEDGDEVHLMIHPMIYLSDNALRSLSYGCSPFLPFFSFALFPLVSQNLFSPALNPRLHRPSRDAFKACLIRDRNRCWRD